MIKAYKSNCLKIEGINLWAHVGVLEEERLYGQAFLLAVTIWIQFDDTAMEDNLSKSADYSFAVKLVQELALDINCMTIEYFSEQILNCLENFYGALPIEIILTKCSPPIPGFDGTVSIKRTRNLV